jgi:tetratricopeptide (TPR) repeat protein
MDSFLTEIQRGNVLRSKTRLLLGLGAAYNAIADRESALKLYIQAQTIAQYQEDLRAQTACLINIGNIQRALYELPDALASYEQAEKLAEALKDDYMLASILWNMTLVYDEQGQVSKGILLAARALSIYDMHHNTMSDNVRAFLDSRSAF